MSALLSILGKRWHIKQLKQFHVSALLSILGKRWQDKITSLEILGRAATTSIEALLLKVPLRGTGRVIRMEEQLVS